MKRKIKHESILIIIVGILLFMSYWMFKVGYDDLQYYIRLQNTRFVIVSIIELACAVTIAICSLFVFYNATCIIFHDPKPFDLHPEHTMD